MDSRSAFPSEVAAPQSLSHRDPARPDWAELAMTRRRIFSALAVGVALSVVVDVALLWLSAEFDSNLFGF